MQSNPAIFVSGFGPFDIHDENASQVIVENLVSGATNLEADLGINLHTEILDVAYDSVFEKVPKMWDDINPKLVIHIGVSHKAQAITLEKQAFNQDYNKVDVRQCLPLSGECIEGFPKCSRTLLDLERVVKEMEREEDALKCIVSHDPGTYLCGFVYYLSLSISNQRSLFIHVPMLSSICPDRDEAVRQLVSTITQIIKCLYRQVLEIECEKEDIPNTKEVLRRITQLRKFPTSF